jgi:hypothetical protein
MRFGRPGADSRRSVGKAHSSTDVACRTAAGITHARQPRTPERPLYPSQQQVDGMPYLLGCPAT